MVWWLFKRKNEVEDIKEGVKKVEEKLADLSLARKVEARLMDIRRIDTQDFDIRAEGGMVTLSGMVYSVDDKEECEREASRVKGVKKVENLLSVAKYWV